MNDQLHFLALNRKSEETKNQKVHALAENPVKEENKIILRQNKPR